MSNENVNENETMDFNDDSVVEALLNNPEIASLPLGSDEQKAALEKLNSGKTNEPSADSSDTEQNGDEESEEQSDDESEPEIEQKKPPKGIQKRFDEMTKKIKDLERQLTVKQNPETFDPQAPLFEKEKPKAFEFEDLEDFYEADAEWRYEKAQFLKEHKSQAEVLEQKTKELVNTWDSRVEALKSKVPDFDDVVTTDAVHNSGAMQPSLQYMFKQDLGPQLAYKLFSDPELLAEFKEADAVDQVAILAELKLSISPSKKTTNMSQAPNPPKALPKASGSASRVVIKDDISDAEFDKILAQEIKRSKQRF